VIALDTNLLVYAHRAGVPQHKAAQAAVQRALEGGCGIPSPCVAEFWSVVTHTACVGGPSSPARARSFLSALWAAGIEQWLPQPGICEDLVNHAKRLKISGARVFDLQIAIVAAQNGAVDLWTHDQSFVSIPGVNVHDPL